MSKIISNNIFMLKYVWKYCKSYIIFSILLLTTHFLSPLQDTIFPKFILDALMEGNRDSAMRIAMILASIAVYKAIVWPLFGQYLKPLADTKLKMAVNNEMIKKVKHIDLECYDNPEFYDQYTRALQEADQRTVAVYSSVQHFLGCFIYMGTLLIVITILDPFLLLLGILSVAISLVMDFANRKLKFKYEMEKTALDRKQSYIKRVLYQQQYAKEIRTYGLIGYLSNWFAGVAEHILGLTKQTGRKVFLRDLIAGMSFSIIFQVVGVFYLTIRILNGHLTPGDFIALLLASMQFASQLTIAISSFNEFYENSLYITNLRKILDYKPIIEKDSSEADSSIKSIDDVQLIEFKNVSFSYPNQAKQALSDVSFQVKRHEKVAIVGLNGAGKSTVAKMLIRLYDPCAGGVYVNDTLLREYNVSDWRKLCGLVFQDFNYYAVSIIENVLLTKPSPDDYDNVWYALEKVGLAEKIRKLPQGLDSPMTQEFDEGGVMFSGGELQALALSRLFVKEEAYPVIVLDEPSSSLDPIAEYTFHKNMLNAAKDRTVIFITHRLSTAKDADKIIYFENGTVAESGSHDELMAADGKYRLLYETQSRYYKNRSEIESFK